MQSTTIAASSRDSTRVDWQRILPLLTIVLSAAIVLGHAILMTGGSWGADEYFNFTLYRDHGLQWLIVRLLHWSPRPSSDGVLYLYSVAVNHWHMPLIAPYLAVLWAILIGSTLAAAWQRGVAGTLPRLALASTVLAMFFLGHRINDLFLWPMGATPYLLDLAGIAVVAFQVVAGGAVRHGARLACGFALVIAATSSETGLFFSVIFAVTLSLLERPAVLRAPSEAWKGQGWYLTPLLVALATAALLLYIVVVNPARGIDQASPYFHHFGRSLAATLFGLPADILGGDGSPSSMGGLAWLLTFCLLFAGFRWACRAGWSEPARWREMAALSVGLAGCYLLTLFTSYYEYSQRVHEPQTAFRRCLVILGLLVAARMAAMVWPTRWRLPENIGPLALCAALGVGMIPRVPALVADWHLLPQIRHARDMTWDSGADPSSPTLRFYTHPQGRILNELIPERAGTFRLGAPETEWWMTGLMQFFAKRELQLMPVPAGRSR